MTVRATAYSPEDPGDARYRSTKGAWLHITADGKTDVRTTPYGIAVPRVERDGRLVPLLPYGTRVYIPTGYNYLDRSRPEDRTFTVDDTGGALSRKTKKKGVPYVDLRFKSYRSAKAWAGAQGWRTITIFVIEP
jgi:3D (Asp-Asp-Asp) domain-containing protein